MRLVLHEPDIPQNTGAMLRLAACLGVAVDLIEPCGFILDDRRLRRAGMDYLDSVELTRHGSWAAFLDSRRGHGHCGNRRGTAGRLLLLTTAGETPYTGFAFRADDSLMVGSESRGAPAAVHAAADARLVIPMRLGLRSLNVALAAAMALGEALRQIDSGVGGSAEPAADGRTARSAP